MTMIDGDLPLGEIVNRVPGSVRILQSFGLDFCCGGAQSLDDAATELGLDSDAILAELVAIGPGPVGDWVRMTPGELVDHIESTHHAFLHAELGRLDALARKVESVHGDRHPELVTVAADVREMRADLEPHLLKEERILFPLIRRIAGGETPAAGGPLPAQAPIAVMMADHEVTGDLLARLRADSRDYVVPEDGCASYRALYEGLADLEADIHLHVHKENNVLFPAVLAMASDPAVDDALEGRRLT